MWAQIQYSKNSLCIKANTISQNCFWFRTFFLAKNQCAPARQKFWIRLEKWGKISGTRFARPTFWLLKNRSVRWLCLYCTKLEPISKTNDIARPACVVAWNCLVRSYRSATASQSLGNPERKTLLTFLIWRGWNFFWKRKGCFSFGVLPSKYSGSVAGLQCGLGFAKTIFWGKDFAKPRLIFLHLPARRKGSGEWMRAGFRFEFWPTGLQKAELVVCSIHYEQAWMVQNKM